MLRHSCLRSNAARRGSIPIILEIQEGNKLVTFSNLSLSPFIKKVNGNNLEFDSLTSCVAYLKSLGIIIKRDTLSKYIKLGKVFYDFKCRYLEKSLPVALPLLCAALLLRSSGGGKGKSNNRRVQKKQNRSRY